MTPTRTFTPALGHAELTGDYDRVIGVMTREVKWRGKLVAAIAPERGETIVDLGSGTGSLATMIAKAASDIQMIAVDPDPEVHRIAVTKFDAARIDVRQVVALGGDRVDGLPYEATDKVASSLVLHQCPLDAKLALLANAYALLKPGGSVFIADYGLQRTVLMQMLFKQVRALDGYENTKANKDGMIPIFMADAGFHSVAERWSVQTPTGSISLWTGRKPGA